MLRSLSLHTYPTIEATTIESLDSINSGVKTKSLPTHKDSSIIATFVNIHGSPRELSVVIMNDATNENITMLSILVPEKQAISIL